MQTPQDSSVAASSLERRIDMSVAVADIDREVEQRLKRLARTVKMHGFRPGKVPLNLVAKQYGPQVRSEALGDAVERAFGEKIREQNLRVAGYPRIEPKTADGQEMLQFSAVFEIYPEVTPADISDRDIERPLLEVGDAEVDKTIEVLRKQRKTYTEVGRAAQQADRVVIDFTGRLGGEVFPGGEGKDFPVVLGAGGLLKDFEDRLLGLAAGGQVSFDLTFPDDYHARDLAGKQVQFEVSLKRVEEPRLPEVDAEFARGLGIADGDVAKMRAEVKANLEREVKKRISARLKGQVMDLLLAANPLDVPKALVETEAQQLAQNMRQDLTNRGMDPAKIPLDPAVFGEQAQRRVKLGLILAEVVKTHSLHAKPEQLRAFVEEFAQSYEDPKEVVRWYYSQPQRLSEAEAVVIEDNVVAWALATARVTDKAIDFDELMGTNG